MTLSHMLLSIVMLIGGLLLLYKGADWLVSGSSSLARRSGMKPIIVGLTVVAFGTSAPELAVGLTSTISGQTDIAVSLVFGSNIANILLILGIVAAIRPLKLRVETVLKEMPLALLAAGLVWFLANDRLLTGAASDSLNRMDGVILLAFFLMFIYYVVTNAAGERGGDGVETKSFRVSILLTAVGLLGLFLGGELTVRGAAAIAGRIGLSERFIALTVIAIGTSLPELLTSVVAVIRRNDDIAVGNIVGSNIFNLLWILGLSAVIRPLPVSDPALSDALVVVGATVLMLAFSLTGRKLFVDRWQGAALLGLYAAYLAVLLAYR